MLKIMIFIVLFLSFNAHALMRFTTEQITNPYKQGWSQEKVILEDSLNLFHLSNVRVNKAGYNTDASYKKAFVYEHKKGEKFYLIHSKTGIVEKEGVLDNALDFEGNSVESTPIGGLESYFFFDGSKPGGHLLVTGYPKDNNRDGEEKVNVAEFSDVETNGFYFIACGEDTSETFEIGPYVLNKIASLQSMFLGFQRCGGQSWSHLDCHLKDGSALGEEYEGRLTGGWHDCGDHIKVGQNEGFTTMMLAFIAVVGQDKCLDLFNGDFTDTLKTDGIPDHLREAEWGARYIMKLYNLAKETGLWNKGQMYTGIGGPHDHSYWDLPAIQDAMKDSKGGAPREISAFASSDIYGSFASALAFFASEWSQGYNKEFADSCLTAASEIYELGKQINGGEWNFPGGFYFSNGQHYDEMAMAAVSLAYAHKTMGKVDDSHTYIDDLFYNEALGSQPKSQVDFHENYYPAGWVVNKGQPFWHGSVDWQNIYEIASYAMLKLILKDEATAKSYNHDRLTGKSEEYNYDFLRTRTSNVLATVVDGAADYTGKPVFVKDADVKASISYPPYNIPNPNKDWGWNRYMMGRALIPFLFGEYVKSNIVGNNEAMEPYKAYAKYFDWGVDVINYLCGMNPWDLSLIVGAGEKFPHHIHNRTACAEIANTGSPAYNFIPPYGSLVSWEPPNKKMVESVSEQGTGRGYFNTETCVDFSMAVGLAMITVSKSMPEDLDPPLVEDVNYIQIGPDKFYFSWNTDELANCELYWAETSSPTRDGLMHGNKDIPFENPGEVSSLKKFHELTIDGLSMDKTYFFLIKATDRTGNVSYTENEIKGTKHFYKFKLEEMAEATIDNLLICPKDEHTVKVAWWTDVPSNSVVDFWEQSDKSGTLETVTRDDNALITNFHVVTLDNLKASTKYGFTAKSSNDEADSTFETDYAFARFKMMSARSNGDNPEFMIYLQNADYEYNQSYDGFLMRIYLDYPEGYFTEHLQGDNIYRGFVDFTDWGILNGGEIGVKNYVAYYADVDGRTKKLQYKTDEKGNSYIEIDMPKNDEILAVHPDFPASASLDAGGWMYFRLKLYEANYTDEEITNAWSVKAHSYPVVQEEMYLHPVAEFTGNDVHSLLDEYFIGVYQRDDKGNERHLYGYTPTTNLDDPGFYQNYTMELSLTEPVQVPPQTNFTVASDEDIRMLQLKGKAISRGERIGFGNISKLLINKTEVLLPQPNGGNISINYDYPLEDGTNIVNVIAIDETNCAFNNLTLTINSQQADATPATLTVLKQDIKTSTTDAEIDAEKLYFKLVDLDEDKVASKPDKISVTIINIATGDSEVVFCNETGDNTGEFMSNTPTLVSSIGYSGDGVINGASGDIVQVIYQDPNSKSDRQVVNVTLFSNKAGVRFADYNYTPLSKLDKKNFDIESDSLFVRLVDYDNQDKNSLAIKIYSLKTGDVLETEATKLDGNSTVQPYGFGPLKVNVTDAVDKDDDVLSISLVDKIIVEYTDKVHAGDVAYDTLALNASFNKVYISWSELLKDTIPNEFDTTVVYTTDKEFSLYSLGIKEGSDVAKANIRWDFYELENRPFQFYKNSKAKDTMMTVTLTGESEGLGYIDGKFLLDQTVPVYNSGIIKVVDPIDRIFVISRDALKDGLTLSDTLNVIKGELDVKLGLPIDAALIGIDDDKGQVFDIGGFWTIEKAGNSLIIDTTYSGVYPPNIDINSMEYLGEGELKVVYNSARGLIKYIPVNVIDPVDLVTVNSSSFVSRKEITNTLYYGLDQLFINNSVYVGDTIKVDYNRFPITKHIANWVKLKDVSNGAKSSTVLDSIFIIDVEWTVENVESGKSDNFNFRDTLDYSPKINDLLRITAKRNSTILLEYFVKVVDMIDFGFAPNPISTDMLQDGVGELKFVSDKEASSLNCEIFDINGNIIFRYDSWESKTMNESAESGDFKMSKEDNNNKTLYVYRTLPKSWDGKSIYGSIVNSGAYTVVLTAYDNDDKMMKRKVSNFYIINKK